MRQVLSLVSPFIRLGMTTAFAALRLLWFFTRPHTNGVQIIVFTPAGKTVLVRQSYTRRWMLPGGGSKSGEDGAAAAIRELTEEIGLHTWQSITKVDRYERIANHRHVQVEVFAVHGAGYTPHWSLEIEAVGEFAPDQLPPDCDTGAARQIAAIAGADRTKAGDPRLI